MMIDMRLFAALAVAVAVVGLFLWFKPRPKIKPSGVGDIGQNKD
jgi:hypothetical protein